MQTSHSLPKASCNGDWVQKSRSVLLFCSVSNIVGAECDTFYTDVCYLNSKADIFKVCVCKFYVSEIDETENTFV